MLGNDNLRHATKVVALLIVQNMIILRTMHKQHHIGILLDGSRLTKVAQLRTLAFKTLTILNSTVQLRQSEYGDIKLLGKSLKRLRNL